MSARAPIILRIPREAPSGNALRRRYRHWAAYRDLREMWELELLAAKGRRPIATATGRMAVHVIRSYATRPLDDEGAEAGLKPIFDCLTRATKAKPYGFGWIVDDNPKWLRRTVEQVKSAEPFVEIRLSPVDDALFGPSASADPTPAAHCDAPHHAQTGCCNECEAPAGDTPAAGGEACRLCARGVPVKVVHYGTQAHGMIEDEPCRVGRRTAEPKGWTR